MTGTASHFAEPDADGETWATEARTFPWLLADRARLHPDRVALQEKRYGIWQPLTWRDCHDRVRDFAHGLASLGVDRGQAVAVIGDNRPEWLIAEFAAQSLGAAVVGVEPTSSGEEIAHVLDLAEARVVVVEGQEQVDQLIDRGPRLPLLAAVVYYDPRGLEQYAEPYLHEFAEVQHRGRAWGQDRPGWLDARVAEGGPDEVAVICTTSGASARPELAELTHRCMLAAVDRLTEVDPVTAEDRYICFLPLASIGEQLLGVARALTTGAGLSFPEQASTQRGDLREIGPAVMFAPPRVWESMLAEVQVRLAEAGWLKRTAFGWSYGVGGRVAALRVRGRTPGLLTRLAHPLADRMALRPVRDHLGLLRIRRCYTSGPPLGPGVFGFFHALGVNLKQAYCKAEVGGIATVHRDGDVEFDTVGIPLPGIGVELSDRGEILLRCASPFRGYRRSPEAAARAVDERGWLHTGEAGRLDDSGHLVVLGPQADVVVAGDGRRFARASIESKLRSSPYVAEAVVVGEPQPAGVSAVVAIEPRSVGAWAQRQHLAHTDYADLAGHREVYELVAEEIGHANRDLPEVVRVHRFVLLHRRFDPDDEITWTREVRRDVIASRHAELIDAVERGDEAAATSVRIHEVPENLVPPDHGRRPIWSLRR
ncbi:MAG: AMP-binding protein [Pseudonocardiaceae bacterium]|nr:AMP-binding protein [Pseudonocardiaceae bacterium]